jgi:hypothetical protein
VSYVGLSHLRLEESTAGDFFYIKRLRLMRQVSNPDNSHTLPSNAGHLLVSFFIQAARSRISSAA